MLTTDCDQSQEDTRVKTVLKQLTLFRDGFWDMATMPEEEGDPVEGIDGWIDEIGLSHFDEEDKRLIVSSQKKFKVGVSDFGLEEEEEDEDKEEEKNTKGKGRV